MHHEPWISRRQALKRGGMVAGAALFGPALSGCAGYLDAAGSSPSSKKAPVLLGIVDPYTGPFAAAGTSQTQGCELAVAELNRAGGILGGRQVEIRKRDDATKADVGARGARELIQQEGVDVIVGMASSAVALAVSEACAELGCPLVISGAHDDTITGTSAHRTTFRVNTGSVMVARVVVEPLMTKTGNRWFFITSDYAYGLGAEAMIAELTRRGGTVVAAEHTPLGTSDFKTIALGDAEKLALSKQENRAGLDRIGHEKLVTRAGYRPKEG